MLVATQREESWLRGLTRSMSSKSELDSAMEWLDFVGIARLAKLPRPQLQPLVVADCVGRAVSFETRLPVQVEPGPGFTIQGDPDQLEQVLINLLRNAADASLVTKGGVTVGWQRDTMLEIWIKDEGPGLSSTANLFVPFFTTKPGGSGIGLAAGALDSLQRRASGCAERPFRTGRLFRQWPRVESRRDRERKLRRRGAVSSARSGRAIPEL